MKKVEKFLNRFSINEDDKKSLIQEYYVYFQDFSSFKNHIESLYMEKLTEDEIRQMNEDCL